MLHFHQFSHQQHGPSRYRVTHCNANVRNDRHSFGLECFHRFPPRDLLSGKPVLATLTRDTDTNNKDFSKMHID